MLISSINICSECKEEKEIASAIYLFPNDTYTPQEHKLCKDCYKLVQLVYSNSTIIEKKEANECSTLIH